MAPGTAAPEGDYNYFVDSGTIGNPFASGGTNNAYSVTAALQPLALNSAPAGNPFTMQPTAAVMNVIPSASCDQTTDERGHTRPGAASQCTPGAYENP